MHHLAIIQKRDHPTNNQLTNNVTTRYITTCASHYVTEAHKN